MDKKVLVIGGSGMLGRSVTNVLANCGEYRVHTVHRTETEFPHNVVARTLDVTDTTAFGAYLADLSPDIVVNCAAIVDVDACERNPKHADAVHSGVLKTVSVYSPDAKMVYISTDSVFDGKSGGYAETDIPAPLNYYAKSKLAGESETMRFFENWTVIRTNIYGFHVNSQRSSLAEWALKSFRDGKQITGFIDVLFNPLYTGQLAEIVQMLIKSDYNGMLNAGCETYISKYEFLVELAKVFNLDPNLVIPGSVKSMPFVANRPQNTTLRIERLKTLSRRAPSLNEGLQSFFKDYLSTNTSNGIHRD